MLIINTRKHNTSIISELSSEGNFFFKKVNALNALNVFEIVLKIPGNEINAMLKGRVQKELDSLIEIDLNEFRRIGKIKLSKTTNKKIKITANKIDLKI